MPTADPPHRLSAAVASSRPARQVRAVRGVAAASVATVVAATAHTLAGGGPPPPVLVAVVILLASPVAVALAGRSLALWRLALTVLVSQVLFHMSFAIAAGATGEPAPAHAHHLVGPAWVHTPTASVAWPPAPLMVAGHVVAAIVTVLALHRGERMLRALARGVRGLVGRVVEIPTPASPRSVSPVLANVPDLRSSILSSEKPTRGPPRAAPVL
ncbi:hypothetical protein G5T42_00700 [Microbacterium sp. 4R-513]|uniref:hypothetical protein n=1 Tax=Microbacterium sp. 4R-513 TaxID=2567934 RepID=UPI0013E19D65|nr:hypothetical protein [Microbacterium sp. 4R-513]QIG38179.1 hypothetical protein G5T42_00700 [Microbacterium sp. 4R-513]